VAGADCRELRLGRTAQVLRRPEMAESSEEPGLWRGYKPQLENALVTKLRVLTP
jgi:hypothetical protein